MPTLEEFLAEDLNRSAAANATSVVGGSSDDAARAIELAPKVGVPAPVIRVDPQYFEERQKIEENNRTISESPELQRFLAKDPIHAEVVKDELPALRSWADTGRSLVQGFELGRTQTRYGLVATEAEVGLSSKERVAELRNQEKQLTKDLAAPGGWLPEFAGTIAGQLYEAAGIGGAAGATAGALSGAAVGSVVPGAGTGIGAAVGAAAGFGKGMVAHMWLSSYGRNLDRFRTEAAETGNTISEPLAHLGSVAAATTEAATALLGLPGPTRTALTQATSEAVARAATIPTIKRAISTGAREATKAGLVNAGGEGVAFGVAEVVNSLVKSASPDDWATLFNDPSLREEFVNGTYQALVTGLGTGAALHAPGLGVNLYTDMARIRSHRQNLDLHKKLMAAELQTKAKSPEAIKLFAQEVVGDQTVSIDLDVLEESGATEALRTVAPNFDQQLESAMRTGGSIEVPYADYLARIDPETDKLLQEGIRFEVGGLSVREAAGMEAWHASPHTFDAFRFDETTFRTGEGAASYGAGIYVAENRAVADEYHSVFASDRSKVKELESGETFDLKNPQHAAALALFDFEDHQTAIESLKKTNETRRANNALGSLDEAIARGEETIRILQSGVDLPKIKPPASMYRVKIKAKPEELLDWDKPLSEQPESVKKVVREIGGDNGAEPDWSLTGEDLYKIIAMGDDMEASRKLREAGIPGLRYLDQGSRGHDAIKFSDPRYIAATTLEEAGGDRVAAIASVQSQYDEAVAEGLIPGELHQKIIDVLKEGTETKDIPLPPETRNIVVFDDSRIEILDRNGEPLQGAEREAALAEYGQPEITREPTQIEGELAARITEPPVIEPALATREGVLAADETQRIVRSDAEELWLQPLFKTPAAGGMDAPMFRRYSARIQERVEASNDKALNAARIEAKRRQTKWWKSAEEDTRNEVRTDITGRRDLRLATYLTEGRMLDESFPIPEEFKEKLKESAVREITNDPLPAGTTAKDGVDPDELAPLFGYRSGEELVRDLVSIGRDAQGRPLSDLVRTIEDEEVVRRMEEKFGELDDRIEQEARKIAVMKSHEDMLHEDLKILGEQIGAPPFEIDALRAWARTEFAAMPMKQALQVAKFRRNVGKAGRNAEMALLEKQRNIPKAFQHKQQQLTALLLLREAEALQREFTKSQKRFKRLAKPSKTVSTPYMDQIHKLMSSHNIKVKRTPQELADAPGPTLEGFVNEKAADGVQLMISPELYGPPVRIEAASVDRFRMVADAVKSLEHTGRKENKVLYQGKLVDRKELIDSIVDRLEKLPRAYGEKTRGALQSLKHGVLLADNQLVRMAEIIDDLDGNDPSGPLNQVFRTLVEAKQAENVLFDKVGQKLEAIPTPKRGFAAIEQNIFIDPRNDRPMQLTRWDLRTIALNTKNKQNLERLAKGYNLTEDEVLAFVNQKMTPEEWVWVDGVLDVFKFLWPMIDAKARRTTGVGPDKVEGDYFPLFYDPAISNTGLKGDAKLFEAEYQSSTPRKNYMKSRVEGFHDRVHIQNLGHRLPSKIKEMIHDLTFHEPLVEVNKVLGDTRVRMAITRSLGEEYTEQIEPFLKYVANRHNGVDRAVSATDKLLRFSRLRLAVTVLGLNLKTLSSPNLGRIDRILKRMGTRPLETISFLMNHPDIIAKNTAKSVELRYWDKEINRELNDLLIKNFGSAKSLEVRAAQFGFGLVSAIERRFARFEWLSVYMDELNKGTSDADATYLADKAIRDSFGRSGVLDLPPIMRGGEGMRLLTTFYGFGNVMYQRTRRVGKRAASGTRNIKAGEFKAAGKDFARVLADTMAFVIIPAMFGVVYNPPTQEEYEELAEGGAAEYGKYAGKLMAGQLAQTLPFARELAASLLYGYPPRGGPLNTILETLAKSGKDIASVLGIREEEVSDKWLKNAMMGAGFVTGLPTGQIGTSLQYLWDVEEGNQSGETFEEVSRGIFYGESERR